MNTRVAYTSYKQLKPLYLGILGLFKKIPEMFGIDRKVLSQSQEKTILAIVLKNCGKSVLKPLHMKTYFPQFYGFSLTFSEQKYFYH